MAYKVDKFNGTFLTSVEDGTIDTTTDLRFVGKNYAGYGEVQNENFLHLLENFANTTAPPKAISGQIWFDSGEKKLKFYDGSQWKVAAGAVSVGTAPSNLASGELWWDSSAKQLYAWSGTEFILVGPEASPDLGASNVSAQVVKGTDNANYTILKMTAGGKVIAIISQSEFTLNNSINPIEDFGVIKKGVTLAKSSDGISDDNYVFWGTASNALQIGGVPIEDLYQKGNTSFEGLINFENVGWTLGASPHFAAYINPENATDIILESQTGTPIKWHIKVDEGSGASTLIAQVQEEGIYPGSDSAYNLGSSSVKWDNVYANTVTAGITGDVVGNTTGDHTGDVRATDTSIMVNATTKEFFGTFNGNVAGLVTGTLSGTASNASALNGVSSSLTHISSTQTIPIRDTNGTLQAELFSGPATFANRLKIDNSATDTDPNYRTAMTTATANTIAARDGSGDISANLFQGTATAARYADLAEKYLTDKPYDVGTVVKVGGEAEVTACSAGSHAIGVVSENPAFMMNKDLEGGTYIALKGRVPVKVGGKVKKGDTLIAGGNGYAVVGNTSHVFGIALEDSDVESVKLIEVVVL